MIFFVLEGKMWNNFFVSIASLLLPPLYHRRRAQSKADNQLGDCWLGNQGREIACEGCSETFGNEAFWNLQLCFWIVLFFITTLLGASNILSHLDFHHKSVTCSASFLNIHPCISPCENDPTKRLGNTLTRLGIEHTYASIDFQCEMANLLPCTARPPSFFSSLAKRAPSR